MNVIIQIAQVSWNLFVEAAPYLFLGVLVAGLMYLFLSPQTIAKHLNRGRIRSVFKAALLGIPLPLCSCSVLPAAASLRKQGANRGATAAFLISTPESGVDSIAITYALLDPFMTLIRPISAFLTAFAAGIALVDGLKRTEGNVDAEEMIPALESMSFEGPKGTYTIRSEDHQTLQVMYIMEMVKHPTQPYCVPELIHEVSAQESAPPLVKSRDIDERRMS